MSKPLDPTPEDTHQNHFVTATYGPVTLVSADPQPPQKTSWLEHVPTVWAAIRSTCLNLLFLGALLTLGLLTYRELSRSPVMIEVFVVPPQLEEQGLTGTVMAHKLWDEIANIQDNSGTLKQHVSLLPEDRQYDIVEPGSGVSFVSLTNMLRALLNFPQRTVTGEITCRTQDCSGDKLHLTIRMLDTERTILTNAPLDLASTNTPFRTAAMDILLTLDPYTVASFHKQYERFAQARVIALRLIRQNHPQANWAANLMGNMASIEDNQEKAIEWYKASLEFDPEFHLPWNNWGNSLEIQGQNEAALEKYEKAIEIEPNYHAAWSNWGNNLAKLDQPRAAIEKYEKAIEIDPNSRFAWNGWGNRLTELGQLEEAIEKYQKATEVEPNHQYAWNGWGNRLADLGQYEAAIEKYQKSIEIEPNYHHAWNGWGNSLGDLGQYVESFEKFQKAIETDRTYRLAARNWERNLFKYINLDDALSCERTTQHVPPFIDRAGELVEEWKVLELTTLLNACP